MFYFCRKTQLTQINFFNLLFFIQENPTLLQGRPGSEGSLVCGLWDDTRVPGENPHKYMKIQTAHRKILVSNQTFLLWGISITTDPSCWTFINYLSNLNTLPGSIPLKPHCFCKYVLLAKLEVPCSTIVIFDEVLFKHAHHKLLAISAHSSCFVPRVLLSQSISPDHKIKDCM